LSCERKSRWLPVAGYRKYKLAVSFEPLAVRGKAAGFRLLATGNIKLAVSFEPLAVRGKAAGFRLLATGNIN
jgi:hypothetical protein